jgi:hypothetical protein
LIKVLYVGCGLEQRPLGMIRWCSSTWRVPGYLTEPHL